MSRVVVAVVGLLLVAVGALAGPVTTANPVYHGELDMKPTGGTIDRRTGNAVLNIRKWTLAPAAGSDGIYPDQEPIIVAIGEDTFRLEAGALKANAKGTMFTFHKPAKQVTRGVRLLKLGKLKDGTWSVRLIAVGVDFSRLNLEDPICRPMAVIVGDDDGFGGITVTSPSFTSKKLTIPIPCDVSGDWQWITQ